MNLFTQYFRRYFSIADVHTSNNNPHQIINSLAIPNLSSSESDVLPALRSLKCSFTSGTGGISSCILPPFPDDLCGVYEDV